MHKPGVDPENVQLSDVLCDYCHREWTEDLPIVEGHEGSCICGHCLRVAYAEIVSSGGGESSQSRCALCLEAGKDRAALNRADEPLWRSPLYTEACICRRCIKLAAGVLHRDKDYSWRKPE